MTQPPVLIILSMAIRRRSENETPESIVRCSRCVKYEGVGRLRATTARLPCAGTAVLFSVRNFSSLPLIDKVLFQPEGNLGMPAGAVGVASVATVGRPSGAKRWAIAAARRMRTRARCLRHQAREWRR